MLSMTCAHEGSGMWQSPGCNMGVCGKYGRDMGVCGKSGCNMGVCGKYGCIMGVMNQSSGLYIRHSAM